MCYTSSIWLGSDILICYVLYLDSGYLCPLGYWHIGLECMEYLNFIGAQFIYSGHSVWILL